MTSSDRRGFWVYLEADGDALLPVGLELLGKGRGLADQLGEPLTAVILGRRERLAREGIRYGADEVLCADHAQLKTCTSEGQAQALAQLIRMKEPNILLIGGTFNGRDLAGRLAVKLPTGLTANAIRLEVVPDRKLLQAAVPGFGGSILAVIQSDKAMPQMSTVRPGVFEPLERDGGRRGRVESVPVVLTPDAFRSRVIDRRILPGEDLEAAERVVVAGIGTGGDLRLVKELASRIGASVGVTRPLVDMGAAPRERQVGSTGVSLRAKVAVVVGASGDSHFICGLRNVSTIIAINKDVRAPIFQEADVGIVGDLFSLLPQLVQKLERQVTA